MPDQHVTKFKRRRKYLVLILLFLLNEFNIPVSHFALRNLDGKGWSNSSAAGRDESCFLGLEFCCFVGAVEIVTLGSLGWIDA